MKSMVTDIILDTHVFVDFLDQYYNRIIFGHPFVATSHISNDLEKRLNRIVKCYSNQDSLFEGIVITSIFSFVEIVRKFKIISNGKFDIYQFRAFLDERPPWFEIAPIENTMFLHFFDIPKSVIIKGERKKIEWADSVHCITYLMRDHAQVATSDQRLLSLNGFNFI